MQMRNAALDTFSSPLNPIEKREKELLAARLGTSCRLAHDDLVNSQHSERSIDSQAKCVDFAGVAVIDLGVDCIERLCLLNIKSHVFGVWTGMRKM